MSHGRADLVGIRVAALSGVSAAVAGISAIASFLVVFDLRIGPVVLVLSQRHGRGVHLGDLLIGVPFGLVAVVVGAIALIAYQRALHLLTR